MSQKQPFLRPWQIAQMLGVTTGRVYQLITSGEIPSVRVGGAIRVPRAAWQEWLRTQATRAMRRTHPRGLTAEGTATEGPI